MNGYGRRGQDSFDAGYPQPLRPNNPPNGSTLVDSYTSNGLNGYEKEQPRYDAMGTGPVPSSTHVDLKDTVQVHLLTETALLDSKEYQILSQEEVDDLKKQCQILNQRIEQTRSNLAIQSKYRDAAVSMSRLYSPSGKRRSFLSNRSSGGSDAAREAEAERESIQKKCEDLAQDLWQLEKRIMEPQKRLLEHTAAILQHSHKTAKKMTTPASKVSLVNGVPASPESMYTTSNGRNSLDFLDDGFIFDEASLYRSFDMAEIMGATSRQNTIEIPLKSPVREQHKQLAEETGKLRDENEQLRAQTESLMAEINNLREQEEDQYKLITDTERKLESFNNQLREVIVEADPSRNGNYRGPPTGQADPGDMIPSYLDYLENGLNAVRASQGTSTNVAGKIQALNLQIQDVLMNVNPSHPSPPDSASDVDEQLGYLQDSLRTVEDELQRASDVTSSSSANKQQTEQSEAVLMGLWDIIQSGYAEIRNRKQDRRKTRMEKGLEPDEEDMSDGESFDTNETYSLNNFSAKVQWLYSQATRLSEQKGVLKRQIKQQRDLNNKTDSEKDQQLRDKIDELEEARGKLHLAEKEIDGVRAQLSQAFEDLENLQNDTQNSRSAESAAVEEAHGQLKERNAKITSLEADTREVQSRLAAAEANIESITAQLQEANAAKDAAEKAADEKQNLIKAKDEELEQMTGMVAELKIEATLVKAELDGAYGSRKERAAEVAALHNNTESSRMQIRLETLEKELKDTAKDLTDVVKQSLESEKKIGDLEDELDRVKSERSKLREEKERISEDLEKQLHDATGDLQQRLEAELAKLRKEKDQIQEELDHQRFQGNGPLSPGGNSKTSYLTESYRVGLRAERKKYEEQLRAEQMLRRKVEDELRTLKRAQGPGKSPLSPRQ